MDEQERIRDNVRAMQRIAGRIQADANAAGMGPPGNGRTPRTYRFLYKPKHTTSYSLCLSVPAAQAAQVNAALEYLTDNNVNDAINDAILHHARTCGWEPK